MGVRLALLNADEDPLGWTLIGGRPSANNPPVETDARGVAGFANMTPRSVIVEGIAPDGTRYGRTAVPVKANTITQANLRPNYSYAD